MELAIKVIPLGSGTAVQAGEDEIAPLPPDVEADTLASYLTQVLGPNVEDAWTTTARHPRINVGWIYPGLALERFGRAPDATVEVLVIPMCRNTPSESWQSLFEMLADRRQEFEGLARSGKVDSSVFIELPQREYATNDCPPDEEQGRWAVPRNSRPVASGPVGANCSRCYTR